MGRSTERSPKKFMQHSAQVGQELGFDVYASKRLSKSQAESRRIVNAAVPRQGWGTHGMPRGLCKARLVAHTAATCGTHKLTAGSGKVSVFKWLHGKSDNPSTNENVMPSCCAACY